MMPIQPGHPDLRRLRADLGFSQEALARALDVSARTVERWERGRAWGLPRCFVGSTSCQSLRRSGGVQGRPATIHDHPT